MLAAYGVTVLLELPHLGKLGGGPKFASRIIHTLRRLSAALALQGVGMRILEECAARALSSALINKDSQLG
jgi:hypothetical protein